MSFFWKILLPIALLNNGACSDKSGDSKQEKTVSGHEDIWMPEYTQIPALKNEAMAGSANAAMQLSLWYMKFPDKNDTDLYWTQIAAQNGSAAGQFNLGIKLLSDTSDPLSQIRARYWLSQSAKQGSKRAIEKMAELRPAN